MKLMPIKEGLKYSIIIVNMNTAELLTRCVRSIFKHTKDFEIIIVDNGSTDGSAGYAQNMTTIHPNMKCILNENNRNFGPANNQGVELAEGRRIILLNSDTIVTPDWASRLDRCMDNDEKIAMCGPVTNNSNGRQAVGDIVKNNKASQKLDLDGAAILWGNNHRDEFYETGVLYGWCIMANRKFLKDEEYLFDEVFCNSFEDNDISLRARLKGWKLAIDHSTFVWHDGQQTFKRGDLKMSKYMENGKVNQERFYEKWKPKEKQKLIAVYRIANCEQYIEQSLARTSEFADEIICLFARSQDRTKEIALSFPKVTLWEEWTEPDHPFNEQAERNWLLQKAIEREADWVISVDGDEVYEKKFAEIAPSLMRNPNPQIFAYWCNWRTIWEVDKDGTEKFRADSTFGKFQNYRFFKILPGMKIKENRNIYNHHCGSSPIIAPENISWLNVAVKHLGYDTPEQRQKKYDFYRAADPHPVKADVGTEDYHHLIDRNVVLKTYREPNRVSLVTICKNEDRHIYDMLTNVERAVDEFVIVDTGSTDRTLAEIKRFAKLVYKPVRVFEKKFDCDENGDILNFSQARNWAKSKCRYEWILSMDADERFKSAEVSNVFGFIQEDADAWLFSVVNYLEAPRGPAPEDNLFSFSESMRLYRNIDEHFYSGLIHESLEDSISSRVKNGQATVIHSPVKIYHLGYLKEKDGIRSKVDRYHRMSQKQFEISGNADPRAPFNMSLHYLNDGDPVKAEEMMELCLKLDPTFWRAHQNIAWRHLSIAKKHLNICAGQMPKILKERNGSVAHVKGVLDKFDFDIKKVC